jgi:hypothetical protein
VVTAPPLPRQHRGLVGSKLMHPARPMEPALRAPCLAPTAWAASSMRARPLRLAKASTAAGSPSGRRGARRSWP